jgi:hypothetical protein
MTRRETKTITKPDVRLDDGSGDHDRFAHYVRKEDIVRANVDGVEVIALCGKKWIPNRDPNRYPICPTCQEIMGVIRSAADGGEPGD